MTAVCEAIGIFDSGVGGLTVMNRVAELLPDEPLIYLGDTARVPYGTKSPETVVRYARSCAKILMARGVKMIIVACNTASAYALDALRDELPIPVLGVIEPGAQRAVTATKTGRIGIIGTVGTIRSGAYQNAVQRLAPDVHVYCKPCPLFVPLAEEGWVKGSVPIEVARAYLTEIIEHEVDTLVLGCTHYPLLKTAIQEVVGDRVQIVDSADAASSVVAEILETMAIRNTNPRGEHQYLVTDSPANFALIGTRFLGHEIANVEWIDF